MNCTFCGAENREENRFCGMCGVRFERRVKERRVENGNLKCASCGHANEPGHKFCGMCGARTERRRQERREIGEGPRAVAMANAQLPTPELSAGRRSTEVLDAPEPALASATASRQRVQNQVTNVQPPTRGERYESRAFNSVAGPSFLGLGADPQGEGEYLLQDEKTSGRGLRKLVLLVILMAIAGLIFVQWRSTYRAAPKAPEPPKSDPMTVPKPQSETAPQPNPGALLGGVGNTTSAAGDGKRQDGDPGPVTPPSTSVHGGRAEDRDVEDRKAEDPKVGDQGGAATPRKENLKPIKMTDDPSKDAPKRETAAPVAREKPSAALLRAQQYLQGRGVPRNCEQALLYLKAATEENDPHANVQMAALYASGHCVRQDRVKAYQWFGSAKSLEPANPWIEANLNQLWAAMTPTERRRAEK